MQTKILNFLFWIFVPFAVLAQGTLEVSNLGQTPIGSVSIASDSWIAQGFGIQNTAPITYDLTSIQILLNSATGSPNGLSVSIYSISALSSANATQTDLGNLTGSVNSSSGGIYTYMTPGILLSAGGDYYVVLTAETPLAQGAFSWSAATGFDQNGAWFIDDLYGTSATGTNWTGHVRQDVFQMALFASPVPEPTPIAIGAIGVLAIGWQRWRKAAP